MMRRAGIQNGLRRSRFALWCCAVAVLMTGCSGYRQMKQEMADHTPPKQVQSLMTASAPGAGNGSVDPDRQPEGQMDAVERAAEIAQQRKSPVPEAAVASPEPSPWHGRIAPEIQQRLAPAATDDGVARQTLQGVLDLDALTFLALIRAPAIQAARDQVTAERHSYSQVADLDAVLRQYSAFTEGLMTGVGPMRGMEGGRMAFPYPGVSALKGQVVSASVTMAREALEIAQRDTVAGVQSLFWELQYIHHAREVTAETLSLLDRLARVADTRYRAGNTSFQDVIKVNTRKALLKEQLVTLEESRRNLAVRLLEIMDLPPETPVGRPAEIRPRSRVPALAALQESARHHRSELRRMRAGIERMERMVEMAETMVLPRFTLDYSLYADKAIRQVGTDAMMPTFSDQTAASRGAGEPLSPWFGTQDAWLQQTRERLQAMKAELRAREAATDRMVRIAWFDLDKAVREMRLYRDTLLDYSQSALEVSSRGYESGSVPFADVIGSYTDWLNTRLSLEATWRDIGVAREELERVVSAPVERGRTS